MKTECIYNYLCARVIDWKHVSVGQSQYGSKVPVVNCVANYEPLEVLQQC